MKLEALVKFINALVALLGVSNVGNFLFSKNFLDSRMVSPFIKQAATGLSYSFITLATLLATRRAGKKVGGKDIKIRFFPSIQRFDLFLRKPPPM